MAARDVQEWPAAAVADAGGPETFGSPSTQSCDRSSAVLVQLPLSGWGCLNRK